MYSVVLVATAKHVAEAFSATGLWDGTDFSLKSIVSSIDEALKQKPDCIICPAKSSVMDGCGFSKKIFIEKSDIKVVLYGRRTYEYVQLAVNAHAWGYLSIPIEEKEFLDVFSSIKQIAEYGIVKGANEITDFTEKRQQFFLNLVTGAYSEKMSLDEDFAKLDIYHGGAEHFRCEGIKISINNFNRFLETKWKYGKDSLYTAVSNFIMKTDENFCIFPVNTNNNEIYCVAIGREDAHFSSYLNNIKKTIHDTIGMEISCSALRRYASIYDLLDKNEQQLLASLMGLSVNNVDDSGDMGDSSVVANAKAYINSYYNTEISLDDVASFVCLSSAYFSRLFKSKTGENFIDYLVKVRMENAKRLLESTGKRTYEISQLVGYKKSKYFSKLFKNYSGYTPTEYRVRANRKRQSMRISGISRFN